MVYAEGAAEELDELLRRGIHQEVDDVVGIGDLASRARVTASMRRRRAVVAGVVALLASTGAVAISLRALSSDSPTPADGAPAGPVIRSAPRDQDEGSMMAEIVGELRLQDECITVGPYLVVWPAETGWDERARELLLPPPGGRLALGDNFEGAGGYVPPSTLGSDRFATASDQERFDRCVVRLEAQEVAVVNAISTSAERQP